MAASAVQQGRICCVRSACAVREPYLLPRRRSEPALLLGPTVAPPLLHARVARRPWGRGGGARFWVGQGQLLLAWSNKGPAGGCGAGRRDGATFGSFSPGRGGGRRGICRPVRANTGRPGLASAQGSGAPGSKVAYPARGVSQYLDAAV